MAASKACSACGLCAAACPEGAVRLSDRAVPVVSDGCTGCGICVEVCPRVSMPYAAIEADTAERSGAARHDGLIGHYTRICLGRAASDAVRSRSYWGGATTAFLIHLLETGRIDAALLTDKAHRDSSYCSHARPRIARSAEEILACAFTRPTVNPLLAQLPVAGTSVAVVGTSCIIEALRKAQRLGRSDSPAGRRCRELTGNIAFLIGLNCFFANTATGVDEQLARLGLREDGVKRFFYRRGIPSVELPDGTIEEIPDGNTNFSALHPGCLLCYPSYSARLADITFGKSMSEEWGWNDVICRSAAVESILQEMAAAGSMELREADEGGSELLASLLEAQVFSLDALGYAAWLETGSFAPDETATAMLTRPGGTITGPNRLRLIQAVRRYAFYEPAVAARRAKGLFVPELL